MPPVAKKKKKKRLTLRQKLGKTLFIMLTGISWNCIPEILGSGSWFLRLFWMSILSCSLFFLQFQSRKIWESYFTYATQVAVTVQTADILTFPAITFCNMNAIKKTALTLLAKVESTEDQRILLQNEPVYGRTCCQSKKFIDLESGMCFGVPNPFLLIENTDQHPYMFCDALGDGYLPGVLNTPAKAKIAQYSGATQLVQINLVFIGYLINVKHHPWVNSGDLIAGFSKLPAAKQEAKQRYVYVNKNHQQHAWDHTNSFGNIVVAPFCHKMVGCPHPVHVSGDGVKHCYFLYDQKSIMKGIIAMEACQTMHRDAFTAILDTTDKLEFLQSNATAIFGSTNVTYWIGMAHIKLAIKPLLKQLWEKNNEPIFRLNDDQSNNVLLPRDVFESDTFEALLAGELYSVSDDQFSATSNPDAAPNSRMSGFAPWSPAAEDAERKLTVVFQEPFVVIGIIIMAQPGVNTVLLSFSPNANMEEDTELIYREAFGLSDFSDYKFLKEPVSARAVQAHIMDPTSGSYGFQWELFGLKDKGYFVKRTASTEEFYKKSAKVTTFKNTHNYMILRVRGTSGFSVELSPNPDFSRPTMLVSFSPGSINLAFCMDNDNCGSAPLNDKGNIAQASNTMQYFWLFWAKNTIKIGTGDTVFFGEFISFRDKFIPTDKNIAFAQVLTGGTSKYFNTWIVSGGTVDIEAEYGLTAISDDKETVWKLRSNQEHHHCLCEITGLDYIVEHRDVLEDDEDETNSTMGQNSTIVDSEGAENGTTAVDGSTHTDLQTDKQENGTTVDLEGADQGNSTEVDPQNGDQEDGTTVSPQSDGQDDGGTVGPEGGGQDDEATVGQQTGGQEAGTTGATQEASSPGSGPVEPESNGTVEPSGGDQAENSSDPAETSTAAEEQTGSAAPARLQAGGKPKSTRKVAYRQKAAAAPVGESQGSPESVTDKEEKSKNTFIANEGLFEAINDLPIEQKIKVGYQPSEFIMSCIYQEKQCFIQNFTLWNHPVYGNCYTFNGGWDDPDNLFTTTRAGTKFGLRVALNLGIEEYLFGADNAAGVLVLVNNQKEMPFPEEIGQLGVPGSMVSMSIKKKTFKSVGKEYQDCVEKNGPETDRDMYTAIHNVDYSQQGCSQSCYQDAVIRLCKCRDPFYPSKQENAKVCKTSNRLQEKCRSRVEADYVEAKLGCKALCPPLCDQIQFALRSSLAIWPNENRLDKVSQVLQKKARNLRNKENVQRNLILVEMYFETMQVERAGQVLDYPPQQFICDCGDVLAMWLGVEIMTGVELLEMIMVLLTIVYGHCCVKGDFIIEVGHDEDLEGLPETQHRGSSLMESLHLRGRHKSGTTMSMSFQRSNLVEDKHESKKWSEKMGLVHRGQPKSKTKKSERKSAKKSPEKPV